MKQNTEQLKKIEEIKRKCEHTYPPNGDGTYSKVCSKCGKVFNYNECELICDHDVNWAGDGYFCSRCMLQFVPLTKTTHLISSDEIKREAVKEFVDWLKDRDSEDKKCLVCPKCDRRVEYWGHNQEPLYCEKDGRKMVLKTVRERKYDAVSIYDLEIELLEEYLTQSKEGGE